MKFIGSGICNTMIHILEVMEYLEQKCVRIIIPTLGIGLLQIKQGPMLINL